MQQSGRKDAEPGLVIKQGPDSQLRQHALLVKTPDRLKEPSMLTSKQNCLYGHKGQIFYFFSLIIAWGLTQTPPPPPSNLKLINSSTS